jgi:hypothetical protein
MLEKGGEKDKNIVSTLHLPKQTILYPKQDKEHTTHISNVQDGQVAYTQEVEESDPRASATLPMQCVLLIRKLEN